MRVKGEEHPLYNFFPCTIRAFGTRFLSVEHALQYKKLFDHDMLAEAEEAKSIELPRDVKEFARKKLGKSKNLQWEDKCEATMRHC